MGADPGDEDDDVEETNQSQKAKPKSPRDAAIQQAVDERRFQDDFRAGHAFVDLRRKVVKALPNENEDTVEVISLLIFRNPQLSLEQAQQQIVDTRGDIPDIFANRFDLDDRSAEKPAEPNKEESEPTAKRDPRTIARMTYAPHPEVEKKRARRRPNFNRPQEAKNFALGP